MSEAELDNLAMKLADDYYNDRGERGRRPSIRVLAERYGLSKSKVHSLLKRAEEKGLIKHVIVGRAAYAEVDLDVVLKRHEELIDIVPDILLDLVLVPRQPGDEEDMDAPLAKRIGNAAATRFVRPCLAASAISAANGQRTEQSQTEGPREETSDDHGGWGIALAGGRTVLACVKRIEEELTFRARPAEQVVAIQPLSGTMLVEMGRHDPDACGLRLREVFYKATLYAVMAPLAPPHPSMMMHSDSIEQRIEQARQDGARRFMGLFGLGTFRGATHVCRLRRTIEERPESGGRDVTLEGIHDELKQLIAECDTFANTPAGRMMYCPVGDIANRLFTLTVPRPGTDPKDYEEAVNSPEVTNAINTIRELVGRINERTRTCPIEEMAKTCDVAVLMAGGDDKVGSLLWVLRKYGWRNVVLVTDVVTCEQLIEVANLYRSVEEKVGNFEAE